MSETCVCCGREIPEGRQVCPACEYEAKCGKEENDVSGKHRPSDMDKLPYRL
jgi:hypothetical protein